MSEGSGLTRVKDKKTSSLSTLLCIKASHNNVRVKPLPLYEKQTPYKHVIKYLKVKKKRGRRKFETGLKYT